MRFLSPVLWAAVPFAIALAFAPGLSFYFDVTPRAVALLVAAAGACVWATFHAREVSSVWTSRSGRWNVWLTVAAVAGIAVSAFSSPMGSLAFEGSVWRRSGAEMQIAALLAALLVSIASRREGTRTAVLRGICAAGILSAAYGIAQYFGWDPFQDSSTYRFGEGEYQIIRPPGPFGHSNYLAAFLLWPAMIGVGLWREERARGGSRVWGAATVIPCIFAIVLCGSRGALIGLAVGVALLLPIARPSTRVLTAAAVIAIPIAAMFYYSPAGGALRARVFWASEDIAGGSRMLVWRDSLAMIAARPLVGYGPDTFGAAFPPFQSAELARAYPEFYHESPHNMFLDALTSEGIGGGLWLLAWIALGTLAGSRALKGPHRAMAGGLLAALAATIAAHQFAVFVIPTGFLFLLGVGLLVSLEPAEPGSNPRSLPRVAMAVPVAAALLFLLAAWRLGSADVRIAQVRALLDQNNIEGAAKEWLIARNMSLGSDLYFARRWMSLAWASGPALQRLQVSQMALDAAQAATQTHEQVHNAWYNLAILEAAANNTSAVESSLRSAIAAAPTWYKPHWTLARFLTLSGRPVEAHAEARKALELNARHDAEVTETMGEILRSRAGIP